MANYQEYTLPHELLGRWEFEVVDGVPVPFLRGAHLQNKWVLINTDTSEIVQKKDLAPFSITRSDQAVDFPLDDLLNQMQIDALNAQAVAVSERDAVKAERDEIQKRLDEALSMIAELEAALSSDSSLEVQL